MQATPEVRTTRTERAFNKPAYRYLRASDKLPTYEELGDKPFADIIVKVKLFNPTGIGTWWIAAYNPDTGIAWGAAQLLFEPEVGDIYIPELVEFRGKFGLPIERDLYFKPTPLAAYVGGAQ